jgi:hypothetical protein
VGIGVKVRARLLFFPRCAGNVVDDVVYGRGRVAQGRRKFKNALAHGRAADGCLHFDGGDVVDVGGGGNGRAVRMPEQVIEQPALHLHAIPMAPKLGQQLYVGVRNPLRVGGAQLALADGRAGSAQHDDQPAVKFSVLRGLPGKLGCDFGARDGQPIRKAHVAHHPRIAPQRLKQVRIGFRRFAHRQPRGCKNQTIHALKF